LEAKFAEKGPLGGSDIIETDFSDDAATQSSWTRAFNFFVIPIHLFFSTERPTLQQPEVDFPREDTLRI
jgi:hypothetical protein